MTDIAAALQAAHETGDTSELKRLLETHHAEMDDEQLRRAIDGLGNETLESVFPSICERATPEQRTAILSEIAFALPPEDLGGLLTASSWSGHAEVLMDALAQTEMEGDIIADHLRAFYDCGVSEALLLRFTRGSHNPPGDNPDQDDLMDAYRKLAPHISRAGKAKILKALLQVVGLNPNEGGAALAHALTHVTLSDTDTLAILDRIVADEPEDPDVDQVIETALE